MIINTPRTRASFLVLLLDDGLPHCAQVYIKGNVIRPVMRFTLLREEGETCADYWLRVLSYAEECAWRMEKHQPGESMGGIDLSVKQYDGWTDDAYNVRAWVRFHEQRQQRRATLAPWQKNRRAGA